MNLKCVQCFKRCIKRKLPVNLHCSSNSRANKVMQNHCLLCILQILLKTLTFWLMLRHAGLDLMFVQSHSCFLGSFLIFAIANTIKPLSVLRMMKRFLCFFMLCLMVIVESWLTPCQVKLKSVSNTDCVEGTFVSPRDYYRPLKLF